MKICILQRSKWKVKILYSKWAVNITINDISIEKMQSSRINTVILIAFIAKTFPCRVKCLTFITFVQVHSSSVMLSEGCGGGGVWEECGEGCFGTRGMKRHCLLFLPVIRFVFPSSGCTKYKASLFSMSKSDRMLNLESKTRDRHFRIYFSF